MLKVEIKEPKRDRIPKTIEPGMHFYRESLCGGDPFIYVLHCINQGTRYVLVNIHTGKQWCDPSNLVGIRAELIKENFHIINDIEITVKGEID